MDANTLDSFDRPDRACQLALERADAIDLEKAVGRRKRVNLVEQFVADGTTTEEFSFGQQDAQPRNLRLLDEDRASHVLEAEPFASALELAHHRARQLRSRARDQDAVVRGHQECSEIDQGRQTADHGA